MLNKLSLKWIAEIKEIVYKEVKWKHAIFISLDILNELINTVYRETFAPVLFTPFLPFDLSKGTALKWYMITGTTPKSHLRSRRTRHIPIKADLSSYKPPPYLF